MVIEYNCEAARVEFLNKSEFDGEILFKVLKADNINVKVKFNDNIILPKADGVYTVISLNDNDELYVEACGCTEAQNHPVGKGLNGEDLTCYNKKLYSDNIWQGNTVYHEAVMFAKSSDGVDFTKKSLLYPVEDVISVRSYDLKIWYVKGVDYEIRNGKLVWLKGSKIPIYTGPFTVNKDQTDIIDDPMLACYGNSTVASYYSVDEKKGLYLYQDIYHEKNTVYVTYTHKETWADKGIEGFSAVEPKPQGEKLTGFYSAVESGRNINVLIFGDSVSTGAASSGIDIGYDRFDSENKLSPKAQAYGIKAPAFFVQATETLVDLYGKGNKINYYNIALGGRTAGWGTLSLQNRIDAMNSYYKKTVSPDIVFLKFAANDTLTPLDDYEKSINKLSDILRKNYPKASIVFVSGKINNEKSTIYGNREVMLGQENIISSVADRIGNSVAVRTSSVWADIIKSKNLEDYLSNNINHANDFWAMVTAQTIVATAKK